MNKKYGIILEINPFHNGHHHFIEQALKIANGQPLIAIISGNFVQRGEVSIIDKQLKTKLLLKRGIDLVLELPFALANQGGYYFAYNALNILKQVAITDLIFGSESDDISYLKSKSLSYSYADFKVGIHNNLNDFSSNDILGLSYIRASKDLNLKLDFHTVKRIGPDYNSTSFDTSTIQSASAIRYNYLLGKDVRKYLPEDIVANFQSVNQRLLLSLIDLQLNNLHLNNITIFLSEHNQLLNKLVKTFTLSNFDNYHDLAIETSDKNNSKYKIQRIMLHLLLLIQDVPNEIYIRPLGFNSNGQKLLKNVEHPVIYNLNSSELGKIELRATKLYNLLTNYNFIEKTKPLIWRDYETDF